MNWRQFYLQIEYDDRAKQLEKQKQNPQVQKKPVEDDSEDDDFDIDAI